MADSEGVAREARRPLFSSRQEREEVTGLLIALIAGGCVGWLAGLAIPRRSGDRHFPDVAWGLFGAILGALVLGPVLGGGNLLENRFEPTTLIVALSGAVLTMTAVFLVRRRRLR